MWGHDAELLKVLVRFLGRDRHPTQTAKEISKGIGDDIASEMIETALSRHSSLFVRMWRKGGDPTYSLMARHIEVVGEPADYERIPPLPFEVIAHLERGIDRQLDRQLDRARQKIGFIGFLLALISAAILIGSLPVILSQGALQRSEAVNLQTPTERDGDGVRAQQTPTSESQSTAPNEPQRPALNLGRALLILLALAAVGVALFIYGRRAIAPLLPATSAAIAVAKPEEFIKLSDNLHNLLAAATGCVFLATLVVIAIRQWVHVPVLRHLALAVLALSPLAVFINPMRTMLIGSLFTEGWVEAVYVGGLSALAVIGLWWSIAKEWRPYLRAGVWWAR